MFDDPYKVLGLTPNATDEEVKQAYRRLAKKYHPDMNPGDPTAAKMMNDINAAYDQIKNPPRQETYQNAYDPFAGWQRAYGQENSSPSGIQAARHFVRFGDYRSARNALDGMAEAERTAEWYYLSAVCHSNLGNRVAAMEHIRKTVELEPDNFLYQRTMEQIQSGGTAYNEARQVHFGSMPDSLCKACYVCAALNLCCGGRIGWYFCC